MDAWKVAVIGVGIEVGGWCGKRGGMWKDLTAIAKVRGEGVQAEDQDEPKHDEKDIVSSLEPRSLRVPVLPYLGRLHIFYKFEVNLINTNKCISLVAFI